MSIATSNKKNARTKSECFVQRAVWIAGLSLALELSLRRWIPRMLQRSTLVLMNLNEFRASLSAAEPPRELSLALAGLWWDAKGNWTKAHESAQQDEGPEGSWVHAYLHRKEGDSSNAGYWYRRAGKTYFRGSFEEESQQIASSLLGS